MKKTLLLLICVLLFIASGCAPSSLDQTPPASTKAQSSTPEPTEKPSLSPGSGMPVIAGLNVYDITLKLKDKGFGDASRKEYIFAPEDGYLFSGESDVGPFSSKYNIITNKDYEVGNAGFYMANYSEIEESYYQGFVEAFFSFCATLYQDNYDDEVRDWVETAVQNFERCAVKEFNGVTYSVSCDEQISMFCITTTDYSEYFAEVYE